MRATKTRVLYQVFGLVIDSDIPLVGIIPTRKDSACIPSVVVSRAKRISEIDTHTWQLQRRISVDPESNYWSMYQSDTAFLLEYEDLLQYVITADGKKVTYAGEFDVPEEYFQWNLVHLVLPFLLHLKGVPVYHAGAANTKLGSVVFFGHSGQGKSTLTAAFGKAGYPVVTDDLLVLKESQSQFYSLPSLPWLRLTRESLDSLFGLNSLDGVVEDGDGKMRIGASTGLLPFATEPVPVSGIYVLDSDQASHDQLVKIEPIQSAQAVGILLGRDIMLPILGRSQVAEVLAFLSRLVTKVPVWKITISSDFARLPDVVAEILAQQQQRLAAGAASRAGNW